MTIRQSDGGFVLIHRTLFSNPIFRNDAEAMAFAWMVTRASWKPTRVRYKERVIHLERGQLSMSTRDMANAMDRDKGWVERLWKRLKSDAMIETAGETGVNVVTICNYDKYQAIEKEGKTAPETPGETGARQGQDTEQRKEQSNKGMKVEVKASPLCAEAIAIWNEAAASTGWPAVRTISPARSKALGARLKDEGVDGWLDAIQRAVRSPYLAQTAPSWFTFDWITNPNNFAKLKDGNYDGNIRGASAGRAGQAAPDKRDGIERALDRIINADAGPQDFDNLKQAKRSDAGSAGGDREQAAAFPALL